MKKYILYQSDIPKLKKMYKSTEDGLQAFCPNKVLWRPIIRDTNVPTIYSDYTHSEQNKNKVILRRLFLTNIGGLSVVWVYRCCSHIIIFIAISISTIP